MRVATSRWQKRRRRKEKRGGEMRRDQKKRRKARGVMVAGEEEEGLPRKTKQIPNSADSNTLVFTLISSSGLAQWIACWAHNPEVPGSRPGTAKHGLFFRLSPFPLFCGPEPLLWSFAPARGVAPFGVDSLLEIALLLLLPLPLPLPLLRLPPSFLVFVFSPIFSRHIVSRWGALCCSMLLSPAESL